MAAEKLTVLELCAGAGGQSLGLEQAGLRHLGLLEIDKHCCATLRANRPEWNVIQADLKRFDATPFRGVDLVAAGLPCPPFSIAGKQLGKHDERNLFPDALRVVGECKPKAVMIENVRGILDAIFDDYRTQVASQLEKLGYVPEWRLLNAADFGVPQVRLRVLFVAIRRDFADSFSWPISDFRLPPTVGDYLFDLMSARGWKAANSWRKRANEIAPTIVGGSLKHGGPDLGPTRARRAWAALRVDGLGIADEPPAPDFVGMPRLTVRMVARLQGFPDDWIFAGKKTSAYRQVGNAFPPPMAHAVGGQIKSCLLALRTRLAAG